MHVLAGSFFCYKSCVCINLSIFLAGFCTLYFLLFAVVLSNVYLCFLTNKGIIFIKCFNECFQIVLIKSLTFHLCGTYFSYIYIVKYFCLSFIFLYYIRSHMLIYEQFGNFIL